MRGWTKPGLLVSAGFFVVGLFALAFVAGLPGGRTPGDVHGYDPGGRAVPFLAAGLMTVLAGWALTQEVRARAKPGDGLGPLALVAAYTALAIAFVATLRSAGFVLGGALLVFGLIALNARAAGRPLGRAALAFGAAATGVAAVALDALLAGLVRAAYGLGWSPLQAPHGRALVGGRRQPGAPACAGCNKSLCLGETGGCLPCTGR